MQSEFEDLLPWWNCIGLGGWVKLGTRTARPRMKTLNEIYLDAITCYNRPDFQRYKEAGRWRDISAQEFLRSAAGVAAGLERLGVGKGDPVAIFSENRPEWHIADFAILALGAVDVPVFPKESEERLAYILRDSETRWAIVSGEEQLQKLRGVWPRLKQLEHIVAIHPPSHPDSRIHLWSDIRGTPADERAFVERGRRAQASDLATIIYTSGTTGRPKGVMLSHGNIASNVLASQLMHHLREDDLALSFLPLCHIYERMTDYAYFYHGVSVAYAESFEAVAENMRELRPTIVACVPRFFEKAYARITEFVRKLPWYNRMRFELAERVGRAYGRYVMAKRRPPLWLRPLRAGAYYTVFRRVEESFGGRMRFFISGGAPLSKDLAEYFFSLGILIYQGYGLTETSPVIAVNLPERWKLGTVGPPIPGVEVKIAEDGEILVRGPNVMLGYYKMPEETREAMAGGWFHTGDVGYLDPEGFLLITDRKKDLIKTAAGKFVAPQPLENRLKASPYIENVIVVGDRRRFISALIVPHFENVEHFAGDLGLRVNSRRELLDHPLVHQLYETEIGERTTDFAQYERIKRFALLESDFSFPDGEMTYTMKVRRKVVEERYRELIDGLYADEPALQLEQEKRN